MSTETNTPPGLKPKSVWLSGELMYRAKVVAAATGETIIEVIERHLRAPLAREFSRVIRRESHDIGGEGADMPASRLKISDPVPPRQAAADALADGVVGVRQAVAEFGLTRDTIYRAMAAGTLPCVRVGGRKYVPRAALRAWIAARYTPAT